MRKPICTGDQPYEAFDTVQAAVLHAMDVHDKVLEGGCVSPDVMAQKTIKRLRRIVASIAARAVPDEAEQEKAA